MEFIDHMSFSSICEIGAGSPAFLKKVDIAKKCAIDLDNEHDGSKFRAYATKKFYKSKLKFAYERKRTGRGIEAGTWFINHEIKF